MARTAARPVRVLAVLAAVGALAAAVAVPVAGAARPAGSSLRAGVVAAFTHWASRPETVAAQKGWVQGYDGALAAALSRLGVLLADGDQGSLRIGVEVGTVRRVGPATATAAVTFTERGTGECGSCGGHTTVFATAVRTGGRWEVSWATACAVLEAEGIVCPPTPSGVTATVPPPYVEPSTGAASLAPGLVSPSGLALLPDGNLLIIDAGRDQVLERTAGGHLQVFAGTGRSGFSGDGGPATAAELHLEGVSALAVAPDGTVYLTDTSNDRVRAVAPDGIITTVAGDGTAGHTGDGGPATGAEIDGPTGLAIGPDGSLYIADFNYVRRVAPDGIITTVAGGGSPYGVDVTPAGGTPTAFEPQTLAFDGAGDLFVFSFSPKDLFELPAGPDGPSAAAMRLVAPDYVSAMATAPGGSVVVALNGNGLQRIVDGRVEVLAEFQPHSVPGFATGYGSGVFSPQGVAVAPDGTIDMDTPSGNGYSPQVALGTLSPTGRPAVLPVTGPVTSSLPPVGASGFPGALYPAPVPARRGAGVAACPAPEGLVPFDAAARHQAATEGATFGDDFFSMLEASDRAWWEGQYLDATGALAPGRHDVVVVRPAAGDLYAAVIDRACGRRTVARSVEVTVGPSAYATSVEHLFFVDRDGHALAYYAAA